MENKTEMMDVKEVADAMNCSLPTARRIMKQEDFPLIKVGRNFKVSKSAFREWSMKRFGSSVTNDNDSEQLKQELKEKERLSQVNAEKIRVEKERSEIKKLLSKIEKSSKALERSSNQAETKHREIFDDLQKALDLLNKNISHMCKSVDSVENELHYVRHELERIQKINKFKSIVLAVIYLSVIFFLIIFTKLLIP